MAAARGRPERVGGVQPPVGPAGVDEALTVFDTVEQAGGAAFKVLQTDGIHGHYFIRSKRMQGGGMDALVAFAKVRLSRRSREPSSQRVFFVVRRRRASIGDQLAVDFEVCKTFATSIPAS